MLRCASIPKSDYSMQKFLQTLIIMAIGLSANANLLIKGSGMVNVDHRKLEAFSQVTLNIPGQVFLQEGDTSSIAIEGDDNIIPYIESQVDHGRLTLRSSQGVAFSSKLPLTYKIVSPHFSLIEANGSLSVKTDGTLSSELLDIFINGSSDITLSANTKELKLQITGAGNAKFMGTTSQETISIQGTGQCDAAGLKSSDCKVNISGSGNALVQVTNTLDVRIRGTGRVEYSGSPKLSQNIAGMGSVQPIQVPSP